MQTSVDMESTVNPCTECTKALKNVGIRMLIEINEIDDLNHKFKAVVEIYTQWINEEITSEPVDISEPAIHCDTPEWTPSIEFDELISCEESDTSYFKRGPIFYCFRSVAVEVKNLLRLQSFPCDRQVLNVVLFSSNSAFVDYDTSNGFFFDINEDKPIEVTYDFPNWKIDDVSSFITDKDDLLVSCFVTRNPEFYLYNVVGTSFLIVLCSFTVTAFDVDDFASRMATLITLLLTIIAFKFVINSWVPQLPYLTLLDKYGIISIFSLMIVIAECFIITYFDDSEGSVTDFDYWFFISLGSTWGLFHAIVIFCVVCQYFYTPWENVANSKRYDAAKKSASKHVDSIHSRKYHIDNTGLY